MDTEHSEHRWTGQPAEVLFEAVWDVRTCPCGAREVRRKSLICWLSPLEVPWQTLTQAEEDRRVELSDA